MDGKGQWIATNKKTKQKFIIGSPSRGVYSFNGKQMSKQEIVQVMNERS